MRSTRFGTAPWRPSEGAASAPSRGEREAQNEKEDRPGDPIAEARIGRRRERLRQGVSMTPRGRSSFTRLGIDDARYPVLAARSSGSPSTARRRARWRNAGGPVERRTSIVGEVQEPVRAPPASVT
jgi:hypothetical protein